MDGRHYAAVRYGKSTRALEDEARDRQASSLRAVTLLGLCGYCGADCLEGEAHDPSCEVMQ
jgi:hypothetical protein